MAKGFGIAVFVGLLAVSQLASAGGLSYRVESLEKAREIAKQNPEKPVLVYYTGYA